MAERIELGDLGQRYPAPKLFSSFTTFGPLSNFWACQLYPKIDHLPKIQGDISPPRPPPASPKPLNILLKKYKLTKNFQS